MNTNISLDDKYTKREGYAWMKGIQALARVMIEQQWRDREAGNKTAGIVTGYRGSPLGAFDHVMNAARRHLETNNIHFQPGLNEDLAANTVWGAQQVTLFPGATVDGVYAMWYGKGPGVDRCGDVFKHGNSSGSAALGGVLCIAGDDHNAESSTIPHQTEDEFISAGIPVIFPAGVKEFIEFGLFGIALSRFTGCWVGFTAETECVESAAVVPLSPVGEFTIPADFELPHFGLNNCLEDDDRLTPALRLEYHKLPAARAFARANGIDRLIFASPGATIGIVSAGKTYLDVVEALSSLGIDEAAAARHGIRLYKIGMTWPLEPMGIMEFAEDLEQIIVVEEKRSLIERQIKEILYDLAGKRPVVVGKEDEHGGMLFQAHNAMTSAHIAHKLSERLDITGIEMQASCALGHVQSMLVKLPDTQVLARRPFYCSGCPHNRSTLVPAGSRVMAGIGCHTMAMWMPRKTNLMPQMGGEGVGWIGQHRYTREKHVFVNLGDGSYSHSGSMAIRASLAVGVNVTYKILFNDAVAMTGGQEIESGITVPVLAAQLHAEGVKRVCVVSKEPGQFKKAEILPKGTELFSRTELDAVQNSLRETEGVTVLIYDQTCAAELRRRRKRGKTEDPALRAFINHRVCEGCGDCSKASNCISVEPLETPFGRKRAINQATCNKDITCTDGFCPSFVLVKGGDVQREVIAHDRFAGRMARLPEPEPCSDSANLLICGTGGTGVITLGAILGVAASLDGKFSIGLDQTGLAQKGGTTASHVRISPTFHNTTAARIPVAGADALIGCDLVVTASQQMLERIRPGYTRVILNDHLAPVADFVEDNNTPMDPTALLARIDAVAGQAQLTHFDVNRVAEELFGETLYANMIQLGWALQSGMVPLSLGAVKRAIEMNGVDIGQNVIALDFGRLLATDLSIMNEIVQPAEPKPLSLRTHVELLAAELEAYQDKSYADTFRNLIDSAQARVPEALSGKHEELLIAVVNNAYKLMAYKDEYEVARLYTSGGFLDEVVRSFKGSYRLAFMFAPPWTRGERPGKLSFGPWIIVLLKVLVKLRRIRGGVLDPFGYTEERRMERHLAAAYPVLVNDVLDGVDEINVGMAIEILNFPKRIKGFGHVKEQSLVEARAAFEVSWKNFSGTADHELWTKYFVHRGT